MTSALAQRLIRDRKTAYEYLQSLIASATPLYRSKALEAEIDRAWDIAGAAREKVS